jgi:Tfp pilus assembly protein PilF
VMKSLEREFAPPPVAAAPAPKPTPAPVISNTPAPVVAAKPAAAPIATAPVKGNPAVIAAQASTPKAAASVPLTSPKTTESASRPVAATATPAPAPGTLEVAQVSDSATPKVAQDISTPAPQPALPSIVTPRPVALQPVQPKPEKKSTLLKRLNPMSWFGKKKAKEKPASAPEIIEETPLPQKKTVDAPAPSVVTPPPPKPVAMARYQYTNPAKPAVGNTQVAAQFVSQAITARRNGHHDDAVLACRSALLSDPANFDAAYLLALTEQEASDFPTSLPFFEQALAIKPDSTEARYAFAWSLDKARFPQDAANELEKLLQQSPNDTKANLLLATIYAQNLNQPKLARDHYRKVLETDPHNAQATEIRFWLAANP